MARAGSHIAAYAKMPNVEIAAICDIDESVFNSRIDEIEKMGKKRPAAFTDFRKLLEDKIDRRRFDRHAQPHHTLQTIWACQAGKDVYVEKPCSHDMFEARQIVDVAKKYNRIVQHGTNSRSGIAREAIQKMRDGLIGDIYMARGLCFKWRDTIGRTPVEPVPAGVHYDLWLGPRRSMQFTRTGSTTTGTGSGTTATATSAIRASIRWTWRAGASASSIRPKSAPSAATSCSTTTRRRRTC